MSADAVMVVYFCNNAGGCMKQVSSHKNGFIQITSSFWYIYIHDKAKTPCQNVSLTFVSSYEISLLGLSKHIDAQQWMSDWLWNTIKMLFSCPVATLG